MNPMEMIIITISCCISHGRKETQDLLGEHATAQEALLAKRDQLQFLNSEHNAFAEEVQQTIQQLSEMQNTYGDNVYAPVAPKAAQHTLEVEAETAGFDPIMMQMRMLSKLHWLNPMSIYSGT